jgi:hypothetical protein
LPAEKKKNKLVLQKYIYIFIEYINKTTKQYKIYTPDLQTTVRTSIVNFKEKTKNRTVDLNLLEKYLQSILNILTVYKPIRKSKKLLILTIKLFF